MNNSLSIAFKGQLYKNEASSTNFVYPRPDSDWAMWLGSDPRKMISDLTITGDHNCYTLKVTEKGIIYAYRRIRSGRSGSNCAMVMLLSGGPTRDGKRLTEVLHELLTYAMSVSSVEQIDKEILKEKLSNCYDLFDWQHGPNPSVNNKEPSESIAAKEAYRVYRTDDNLYTLLENPYQSAYQNHNCMHFIPSDANAVPSMGSNMHLIDRDLETAYYITLPNDVVERDGKKHVGKNESFELIYRKPGYKDHRSGSLYVGTNSNYFTKSGNNIIVKTAEESNVNFSRPICFIVSDEKSKPIASFDLKLKKNGEKTWRPWPQNNNRLYLPCKDGQKEVLLSDGIYDYCINSDGYKEKKDQIDTQKGNGVCEITLRPECDEHDVVLIPAFYNRKNYPNSISEKVTIGYKKNNILYQKYQKWFSGTNVPKFYLMHFNPKRLFIVLCFLSILVGVSGGILMSRYVFPKPSEEEQPLVNNNSQPQISQTTTQSSQGFNLQVQQTAPSQQELEKLDVNYLNQNDVWKYNDLKSERYKLFYNSLIMRGQGDRNVKKYKGVYEGIDIQNDLWGKIKNAIITGENDQNWTQAITYRDLLIKCIDSIDLNVIVNNTHSDSGQKKSTNNKMPTESK